MICLAPLDGGVSADDMTFRQSIAIPVKFVQATSPGCWRYVGRSHNLIGQEVSERAQESARFALQRL